jgi:hypothetical protein
MNGIAQPFYISMSHAGVGLAKQLPQNTVSGSMGEARYATNPAMEE